jgi:hypothetical protein
MRNALAFFAVVASSIALVLFAVPALAQTGAAPVVVQVSPEQLAMHAAGVAACINAFVLFLKSPLAGLIWGKVPPPVRIIVLALLAGAAVAFESIAMGKPPVEAILVGVTGLFTAIGMRELVVSVKKKPPAGLRAVGGDR